MLGLVNIVCEFLGAICLLLLADDGFFVSMCSFIDILHLHGREPVGVSMILNYYVECI